MCPEGQECPVPLAQCKRRTGLDPASLTLQPQGVFIFSTKCPSCPSSSSQTVFNAEKPLTRPCTCGREPVLVFDLATAALEEKPTLHRGRNATKTQTSGSSGKSGPSAATTAWQLGPGRAAAWYLVTVPTGV